MGEKHANRTLLYRGQGPSRWPQEGGGSSAGVANGVFAAQKLELSPERNKESPLKARAESRGWNSCEQIPYWFPRNPEKKEDGGAMYQAPSLDSPV